MLNSKSYYIMQDHNNKPCTRKPTIILGECLAFLASGSDPTDSAGEFVFHWRSFDLCTHDISTDFCNEGEKQN